MFRYCSPSLYRSLCKSRIIALKVVEARLSACKTIMPVIKFVGIFFAVNPSNLISAMFDFGRTELPY